MFLNKRKGDIVAQFVVLIVIAVIMIFIVTAFGSKIWGAFFPNEDQSTQKSFELLYSVISSKLVYPLEYDMTPTTLYIKKGYCIVLFYEPTLRSPGNLRHYSPTECQNQQCLCLYDDTPSTREKKKDNDVVTCKTFNTGQKININPQYYDINTRICPNDEKNIQTGSKAQTYRSFLIMKKTEKNVPYIYILDDNEANRALDANWSVPLCTNDATSLCYGKTDGSIVTFEDDTKMKILYDYCLSNQKIKSTSVSCIYDLGPTGADDRGCKINCSDGDITQESVTMTTCQDFNKALGPNYVRYITKDKYYKYYYMCNNDKDYYNIGCKISQWDGVYICKNSVDGSDSSCTPPRGWFAQCNTSYALYIHNHFMVSYNTSNPNCTNFMNTNYYPDKQTILSCKSDIAGCKTFVDNNKASCSLKILQASDLRYWITYYDKGKPDCVSQVEGLFEPAIFCTPDKP